MNKLFKNFINENEKNQELYRLGITLNDNKAFKQLERNFNNYLFKVYLFSYINKSIKYTSYKYKSKRKLLKEREKLTLNINDEEFEEERIYTIKDDSLDYIELITKPSNIVDFNNIINDKKILDAINNLTDRQKEILYKCFILDLDEKVIAETLNISIQSVYKTKNTAIKNIRKAIGE